MVARRQGKAPRGAFGLHHSPTKQEGVSSGAAPGEDEGAVQEFLEFVHTSMDVVRIECTALKDPGDWPKIAEFRVESRNDDGGTEIEHWSVQKARM